MPPKGVNGHPHAMNIPAASKYRVLSVMAGGLPGGADIKPGAGVSLARHAGSRAARRGRLGE